MDDIKLYWNKRENDITVKWEAGSGRDARYFMALIAGIHGDSELMKGIKERGYDITTIKFSISKFKEQKP